jgi:hypothetical protein
LSDALWPVFNVILLPAALSIAVGSAIAYLLSLWAIREKTRGRFAFIVAFGSLGTVLGFLAGNSREPLVGSVITTLLTFITGLLAYVFGKEANSPWQPFIPFALIVLVINTLTGISAGSVNRASHEAYDRAYKEWMMHYEQVVIPAQKQEALLMVNENYVPVKDTVVSDSMALPKPPRE